MAHEGSTLVDWQALAKLRAALGADFGRLLSYFKDDGVKSVAAIEAAVRAQNAAALVLPAHTLKGESLQFGATLLADLAEKIELIARDCVEQREAPVAVIEDAIGLRPLFDQTLVLLERGAVMPPAPRAVSGFGRRVDRGPARLL